MAPHSAASPTILSLVLCFGFTIACDYPSFYNNSVTVIGAKGITKISGCFEPNDSLIKVSYIQIFNESVPVLRRDAIHDLPNLVDIILEKDDIRDIEPRAFYNLPKLYLIKIKHNNIKRIGEGIFNELSIKELCLTNNSIESIHSNAFDNMPNLNIVFLNENKITFLISDWFERSPNVGVLNFEYNLISTIPFRAFKNIKGFHYADDVKLNVSTNIQLNNNALQTLEEGAFDTLETLGWLFLQKNEIEEIKVESLGTLKSIDWVRLEHNKLKCVPNELIEISPKVTYYLSNNPLSDECKRKYPEIG